MRSKDHQTFVAGVRVCVALVMVLLLCAATVEAKTKSNNEAQGIVEKARATFNSFMRDESYGWFHNNLKSVRGLLIYPQVLKAGFILGGSGGTGVLLVRDQKTGQWSQPAFYTIGSVSFGLQAGGEAAEVIVMIMNQKAVDSLLATSVKLGGDTSITVGPMGVGAKRDITADMVSLARSKGLYAGLNLEGSVVDVRESLNKAYYGKSARPAEIIVENKVKNRGSNRLRETLNKAAR